MNDRIKNLEPFWGEWYLTSDRPLGRGGFGAVYEIERRELGIVFKAALKVISIPKDPDEYRAAIAEGRSEDSTSKYFRNMVESMSKEFALMDMVKGHTNIVDYADHKIIERSDEFGWDILIRMELLTPLEKYMIANPLDENEVIRLGIDICSALEVCERRSIIHRDIKPANIFLTVDGNYKLGDFGIARITDDDQNASTGIGSWMYVAPEVVKGYKYDKTVDIYSLGLVMYQLLNNGRLPFYPPAPQEITIADKDTARKRRIFDREELPAIKCNHVGLFEIIKHACAYNPLDRFGSASEMRERLEEVLRSDGQYEGYADEADHNNRTVLLNSEANEKSSGRKKILGIIAGICVFAVVAVILFIIFGKKDDSQKKTGNTSTDNSGSVLTNEPNSDQTSVNDLSDNYTVTPTEEPIVSNTPTPKPTSTPVPTPTSTLIPTPTSTLIPTSTSTPIPTLTSTPTPMPELTNTPTPTLTSTPTPTPKPTSTPTPGLIPDNVKIGDIIKFGSYEQDNNLQNGKEAIEWIVLETTEEGMLVLSKYALEPMAYNKDTTDDVTWETCTLRNWLNNTFYDSAFSEAEKNLIKTVTLKNEDNSQYGTKGGNETKDRIFLLSLSDMVKTEYGFDSDSTVLDIGRRCAATPYAVANGVYTNSDYMTEDGEVSCWWWLRSPGGNAKYAAGVRSRGYVNARGNSVDTKNNAVRPALYIKLNP